MKFCMYNFPFIFCFFSQILCNISTRIIDMGYEIQNMGGGIIYLSMYVCILHARLEQKSSSSTPHLFIIIQFSYS